MKPSYPYVLVVVFMKQILVNVALTLWNRVLLEKLTGTQLVIKFTTFYATQRFVTMFTRSHH